MGKQIDERAQALGVRVSVAEDGLWILDAPPGSVFVSTLGHSVVAIDTKAALSDMALGVVPCEAFGCDVCCGPDPEGA